MVPTAVETKPTLVVQIVLVGICRSNGKALLALNSKKQTILFIVRMGTIFFRNKNCNSMTEHIQNREAATQKSPSFLKIVHSLCKWQKYRLNGPLRLVVGISLLELLRKPLTTTLCKKFKLVFLVATVWLSSKITEKSNKIILQMGSNFSRNKKQIKRWLYPWYCNRAF